MINTGREWDFMEDEVQIEEILTEANAYNLKQEVIKDPIDQFVEKQTEACMEERTSEVARRIIDDKISPPDHVMQKSSTVNTRSRGA